MSNAISGDEWVQVWTLLITYYEQHGIASKQAAKHEAKHVMQQQSVILAHISRSELLIPPSLSAIVPTVVIEMMGNRCRIW